MKKLLTVLAALFVSLPFATSAWAQDESPSKRINKIKRDGQYLYAEATDSFENRATEAARTLLLMEVSEYVASKKKLASANNVLLKDMKAEQQVITMPRGALTRVFLYVKKSDIEPAETVQTFTQQEIAAAAPPADTSASSSKKEKNKEAEAAAPEEIAPAVVETIVEAAPEAKPAVSITDSSLSQWQRNLLTDVAAQPNQQKAKVALNKYKAQNKVKRMGGSTGRACTAVEKAFFLFFDASGNTIALLGLPDAEGNRTDYVSGNTSALANYADNAHVWFELSK